MHLFFNKPQMPPPHTPQAAVLSATAMPLPDSTPFRLEDQFPPVIFSYCTKTDNGRGEEHMWRVANFLKRHGISSFNGKQVEPGEDWIALVHEPDA